MASKPQLYPMSRSATIRFSVSRAALRAEAGAMHTLLGSPPYLDSPPQLPGTCVRRAGTLLADSCLDKNMNNPALRWRSKPSAFMLSTPSVTNNMPSRSNTGLPSKLAEDLLKP